MGRYLARRLLLLVPTMLGITLVVFLAIRFLPGNVVDQLLADYGDVSPELRQELEERFGLRENLPRQYLTWLGQILRGDLGISFVSRRPVLDDLKHRLPVTVELGIIAMTASMLIALPVGVLSAVKQDTVFDYLGRSLAVVLLAVPSFWLSLLVITYGWVLFGWTPPLRYHPPLDDLRANLQSVLPPGIILGAVLSGSTMRLTRSSLLEVFRQDYMRTARAKGVGELTVLVRHGLRNAVLPVITVAGLQVPIIVGGTVVLERVFSLPGMGNYLLTAVGQRDYPVVQAIVLLSATVVVLSNLLVDLTYSLLDPRIRYG